MNDYLVIVVILVVLYIYFDTRKSSYSENSNNEEKLVNYNSQPNSETTLSNKYEYDEYSFPNKSVYVNTVGGMSKENNNDDEPLSIYVN